MHEQYMKRCLELAQRGKGNVTPNPMVGAVLVHNGRIIGEGWHRQYGKAHAEVNCLDNVAEADRHLIPESTMYVSLEPCAHYGKTPPCALRLVQEKVKEVIICNTDPFEQVSGKGIEILHSNGIDVHHGIMEAEGKWVNRRFFCFHTQRRPYIILKWAQTQEGYFAPLNRTRFQMSNAHSKQLLHRWRTEEAAIMVGHTTAMADDPQLTARIWPGRQPLRLVLDKNLVLPHTRRIFDAEASTWVINQKEEKQVDNLRYIQLPFDELLLTRIMEKLYHGNIQSLIVEGGAALLQSFMDAGLWDEARVFTTETMLEDGLRAPSVRDAAKVLSTDIGGDTLFVYTHQSSPYRYISGMEL